MENFNGYWSLGVISAGFQYFCFLQFLSLLVSTFPKLIRKSEILVRIKVVD